MKICILVLLGNSTELRGWTKAQSVNRIRPTWDIGNAKWRTVVHYSRRSRNAPQLSVQSKLPSLTYQCRGLIVQSWSTTLHYVICNTLTRNSNDSMGFNRALKRPTQYSSKCTTINLTPTHSVFRSYSIWTTKRTRNGERLLRQLPRNEQISEAKTSLITALSHVISYLQPSIRGIAWTPTWDSNCTHTSRSTGYSFHDFYSRHRLPTQNDHPSITCLEEQLERGSDFVMLKTLPPCSLDNIKKMSLKCRNPKHICS